MTSRERIVAVLKGQKPDRVPVSLFVQQEYLSYYYDKENTDRVVDAVKLAKELGFDLITRHKEHEQPHYLRKSRPNWEIGKKFYVEKDIANKVTIIKTPKGNLTQREVAPYDPQTIEGIHFTTVEYMINEPETFEIFKEFMPSVNNEYIEEMQRIAQWAIAQVGDVGICSPWGTGGVYNHASALRSVEDLMCDPYDDEDFYCKFMNFLTDIIVRDYDLLSKTDYDCVGMQGNIANAALLGLDFFKSHVAPYEKKVIDVVKVNGKSILYHNCGVARNLYPAYQEMGMSIFETLSAMPQGDNDITDAKKFFENDNIILSGNLDQVNFLKEASVQQVRAKTKEIVEAGKMGGKYIFATSDYLERDTPLENIKEMIKTAKEFGQY